MAETYQLYIDGEWRAPSGGKTFPAVNPYTHEEWAHVSEATPEDVLSAVDAAQAAFDGGWRTTPGVVRGELLARLADLVERDAERLALMETTDNGKAIRETRGQMAGAARCLRYYAAAADRVAGESLQVDMLRMVDYTVRVPVGVVGLITAWNSPISLLCMKLGPALAAGNCVVVKPSEHASVTTLEFARLVEEAGFPAGVYNVVTGAATTGAALVDAPGVGRVSLTGSPGAGRIVAAAAGSRLVPVTLELGGKSPNIIFDDADLDNAVVAALSGIFTATGQSCVAASRLLVHRSVHDEVVARLVERAEQIRLGDPADPATQLGCAANQPQYDKILEMISAAEAEGARKVTGGAADGPGLEKGYFVRPTIFADVTEDMEIAQEEVFGPVLSVIVFDTEEDAVRIANNSRYGLAAAVWTKDISRAMRMTEVLDAGTVWVNTYRAVAIQAPSGGVKESGFGRERGLEALHEYTTIKNVMIDYSGQVKDPFAD